MENEDEGFGEGSHERRRFGSGGGSGGRRNFDRGPREMHKVTCSDCGKETEVPFKPDGTRPVYCRDCYAKRKPKREY